LIALAISFAVDVAARQRARAAKREVEAHLLSRAAVLRLARVRFQACSMTSRTRLE